jgi:hypothetical protein
VYWQEKCMSYTASADQKVFVAVPALIPREWLEFSSLLSPPGLVSAGTVFLHERISPKGHRRLVAADLLTDRLEDGGDIQMWAAPRIVEPGSLMHLPHDKVSADAVRQLPLIRVADAVFCMGQPDSNDASHFTIRVIRGDRNEVIDGWLTDDDRVLLEPRSSPTTGWSR